MIETNSMQQPPFDPMQAQGFRPPLNAEAPPARSWASRHKGAVVGLGCLGAALTLALLIGAILAVVGVAMRSSDPYRAAVSRASGDAAVVAELGSPITAGWFTSGQINVTGTSGHADLSIPISGPRGAGRISVVADKAAGKWTFSTLSVAVAGRPTPIDLLPKLPAAP